MKSVKTTLNCIGVNTNRNISVLGDLFGFLQHRVPRIRTVQLKLPFQCKRSFEQWLDGTFI